jgi:broad specificity phosphatase PhoE
MKSARRILLARHGETAANKDHRLQGNGVNFGLTEHGKEQSYRLGRYLCSHSMIPDVIVSSPLVRAQETSIIIGTILGRSIDTHNHLHEIDFGDVQNYSLEEMKKSQFNAVDYYAGLDIDISYPGGESIRGARDRMVGAFNEIITRYPTETILIVSHGGVLRLLISHIFRTDHIQPTYHENTGLTIIEQVPRADRFMIRTLNSNAHLIDLCYA